MRPMTASTTPLHDRAFWHYNIQEDILHASADGQKFEAKRETFRTRYSSKYFGTSKGVSAVSLNANHMGHQCPGYRGQ